MTQERARPAWAGSTRRDRLPPNWDELRAAKDAENPEHVCHRCGLPGGSELDHLLAGDDHRLDNLDWIHNRADYLAGRSRENCHGKKSGAEGAAALAAIRRRPPDIHPALR